MFIGHYAVALSSKRVAPRVSLGTLILATQFLDLLWPLFLLLGIEHVRVDPGNTAFTPLDFYDYPITHSLVTALGWSIAFGIVYWIAKRDNRSSLVLGLCVLSHWILDFVTHRPDLPIAPGVHRYLGLGLWSSVTATVCVELAMLVIALLLFLRTSRAKDFIGRVVFWIFIFFILAIYVGNVFGGPPPNIRSLAWFGMSQWIVVPWLYWIDRHQVSKVEPQVSAMSA